MAGPFDFLRNNGPYGPSSNLLGIGLGLLSGRTAQEQVANAATNFANDRQMGQTYNKTVEFLRKSYPDLADAVESGAMNAGDAWKLAYQQKIEAAKPKNNFMSVGKNLYNFETGDWITPPAGMADEDEWGLNPVWGQDASGKTVLGQVSKTGKFKPLDTGEFTPTPVLQNIDTGTAVLSRNSRTGAVVAETPKNLSEAERQKEYGGAVGKTAGEAQGALPGARDMAAAIDQQIQSLKNDKYLPNMLGPWDSRTPDITVDAARVRSKMDQLGGGAFLQARQMLKGGGAITDFESARAEAAYARLDRAQSVEDYQAALDEFNLMVQQGLAKLEAQAAMGGAPAPAPQGGGGTGGTTGSGVKWRVK